MNVQGMGPGDAAAPTLRTTRILALIATAGIGMLFWFDTVFASESTMEVAEATATEPASSDAQTISNSPAKAALEKRSIRTIKISPVAMKDMDATPSSPPASMPPMKDMDATPASAPAPVPPMKDMDAAPASAPAPMPPMKDMDATPASAPAPVPPMKDMDMSKPSVAGPTMGNMSTGSMQGGRAPPDARDPDAYAEGYAYTGMRGMEQADHINVAKVLVDELEFLSGNEGSGVNWTAEGTYGGDQDKLWVRTQGQKIPGTIVDASTGFEALWWHATSAFWGSQLGLRQDIGPGAHTYLALGTEGLAPRWFEVQATAYIGEQGRLAGRFKASYDMRLTNRLILTPSVEADVYSKPDSARGAGAGLSTIESGLRLRYEVQRKFAPYVGFVWERSFAGTAVLRRAEGSPVNERSIVAGIRFWL